MFATGFFARLVKWFRAVWAISQVHGRNLAPMGLRIAAGAVGVSIAGQLGGVIGAALGEAVGGSFAEVIGKFAEQLTDEATKKTFENSADYFAEKVNDKTHGLERAMREALRRTLRSIRQEARAEQYSAWFDAWELSLTNFDGPELREFSALELISSKPNGPILLRRTLTMLRAQRGRRDQAPPSITGLEEVEIPDALFSLVFDLMKLRFGDIFEELITSIEYNAAWKQSTSLALGSMKGMLGDVLEGQAEIKDKLDALLDHFVLAKETESTKQRIDIQLTEEERDVWKSLYSVVLKQASPGKADFLLIGDLKSIANVLSARVRNRSNVSSRDYYELGQILELSFDWSGALDAYRSAWRLYRDPEIGNKYGLMALRQRSTMEAIEVFETLAGFDRDRGDKANLSVSLGNLAGLYSEIWETQKAENAYEKALEIRRKLAEKDPKTHLVEVSMCLNNLGTFYWKIGRMTDSENVFKEALKIRRRLVNSDAKSILPDLAMTLSNLGLLYYGLGRMNESENSYDEALEIRRDLAAKSDKFLPDLSETLGNICLLYSATNRMPNAEAVSQEALRYDRRLASLNPAAFVFPLARTLLACATVYAQMGRWDEAESYTQEAEKKLLPLWLQHKQPFGDTMARVFGLRAVVRRETGRPEFETCELAKKAHDCAFDPAYKAIMQELIDDHCSAVDL